MYAKKILAMSNKRPMDYQPIILCNECIVNKHNYLLPDQHSKKLYKYVVLKYLKKLRTRSLCCMRIEDFTVIWYVCPAMYCRGKLVIWHLGSAIPILFELDQLGPVLSHAMLLAQSS